MIGIDIHILTALEIAANPNDLSLSIKGNEELGFGFCVSLGLGNYFKPMIISALEFESKEKAIEILRCVLVSIAEGVLMELKEGEAFIKKWFDPNHKASEEWDILTEAGIEEMLTKLLTT